MQIKVRTAYLLQPDQVMKTVTTIMAAVTISASDTFSNCSSIVSNSCGSCHVTDEPRFKGSSNAAIPLNSKPVRLAGLNRPIL